MSWLSSTNAKEIGTLYLIFSVLAINIIININIKILLKSKEYYKILLNSNWLQKFWDSNLTRIDIPDVESNNINNNNNNNYNNYNNAFILPFILNYFNISIPDESTPFMNYAYGVFILSLICFVCFINVVGYMCSLLIINKYNLSEKYPKFKKLINYYSKSSLIFVIIEIIFCIVILLSLIVSSLLILGVIIIS